MINDRVLIVAPYRYQINKGGPSGFIAHNLAGKYSPYYVLDKDLNNPSKFKWRLYKLRRILWSLTHKLIDRDIDFFASKMDLKQYKFLYFHDVEILYRAKHLISNNQVVILQSHSPQLPSEEAEESGASEKYIEDVKKYENYAFERADIVVFPNEGCVPLYKDVLHENQKIEFILSGAKKTYNDSDVVNYKEQLPKDKINLMYIGRRNQVKVFDIVIKAFKETYKIRQDVHLILVGGGNQVQEEGITDVGFSSNPIGWYKSVDYLINANRKSYFDLSILEAISTGVPIIMANNYGHTWFENKSDLLIPYDSSNYNNLVNILLGPLEKRNELRKDNIELYDSMLSDEKYLERFESFVKSLIKSS